MQVWDRKGAQKDVEYAGLPDHPDKTSIEAEQRPFPCRPLALARNGRCQEEQLSPEASYCALRAISISRMLSSASFTLRSR